jgi:hypothetical protein
MKRLVIIIASAILLFSFTVLAQQKAQFRPVPQPVVMTVQDDTSTSFILFEVSTGEYKFVRCRDGATLTGIGLVKETPDGDYTFEHIQVDRRVVFQCNMTTHEGKGYVETFARLTTKHDREPIKESISDKYMDDSSAECVKN